MKEETELGDFPPTVIPLQTTTSDSDLGGELPWTREMTLSTLWRTAVHVTVNAEQVGSTFQLQGFARAALFAFLVELLAVASVALTLALPVLAVFPEQVLASLGDAEFLISMLWTGGTLVLGFAAMLVLLHWLWAFGTELGAWKNRLPLRYRNGFALASYSCGWDLVTSPCGVALLLFSQGVRSVGPTLLQAVRAPRSCALAYLQTARALSADERRRVVVFAAWVTGPVVLGLSIALLAALVVTMT